MLLVVFVLGPVLSPCLLSLIAIALEVAGIAPVLHIECKSCACGYTARACPWGPKVILRVGAKAFNSEGDCLSQNGVHHAWRIDSSCLAFKH